MNTNLIRKAFVMQVNQDAYEEYKRRHDDIWPEMVTLLKKHGGHNYSIYLHAKTGQLFGYVEIESEAQWQQVANTEICQKWWSYMKDIMETNADNSPCSIELSEVFHMA